MRSQPTAARVARDRRLVSSTVPLKPACSGSPTKITRHSDASKLILISASAVKNASARDRTAHFWMAAPGMRSKWCLRMIGKPYTGLRCLTCPLLLLPPSGTHHQFNQHQHRQETAQPRKPLRSGRWACPRSSCIGTHVRASNSGGKPTFPTPS